VSRISQDGGGKQKAEHNEKKATHQKKKKQKKKRKEGKLEKKSKTISTCQNFRSQQHAT